MAGVFISYRRSDASGYAGRLFDCLDGHFGNSVVFMDVDSIEEGSDYVEVIRSRLASCHVMIVLIGTDWLTVEGEEGKPRLDDPQDFVRLEIEAALERGIPIIPALVGGASAPAESDLPPSLQALARRQAVTIHDERFRYDASRLIKAVSRHLPGFLNRSGIRGPGVRRMLAVAAITACLVLALLFVHVRETEIGLEAKASEVSFVLSGRQLLAAGMALNSLGVSGLEKITLPDAGTVPGATIRLQLMSDRESSISLASFSLPENTRVWIKHLGIPNVYRLSLRGKGLELYANVLGTVEIARPGANRERRTFAVPRAVHFYADQTDSESPFIDLDIALSDKFDEELSRSIQIRELSFTKVENAMDPQSPPRAISSIESGTVSVLPGRGSTRTLGLGDEIRFESSRGDIRSVRLRKHNLEVNFRGYVGGLSTGQKDNPVTLMPTWFEWLRARHAAFLLAGTTLYLIGLAIAMRAWRLYADR